MKKEIQIKCTDGFLLSGNLYVPDERKGAIMIAPATGIKRIFYHSFAQFLAENGYGVITFDNRGIGNSKGRSINDGNPSLVNWGKLDMTAVLKCLQTEFPNTDYHLVGHSAGGQLVGLMDNAKELKSMFNFASSSGSIEHMVGSFLLQSHFFLNAVIPLSNLIFGYAKTNWVGMGEPLPKKVARQWQQWCNGKGYVKVYLDKAKPVHVYDELTFPAQWLYATDDRIANIENVKDMVSVYSNTKSEIVSLQPTDFGFTEIGHMKFFSSKKRILWKYAINWLANH